ncbi:MAG: PAS domain S-box protein [Candidatus Omnitrophica bacterium]|nr:PAS domain S-box protein [Candidatus Omnitrophota bacterium]
MKEEKRKTPISEKSDNQRISEDLVLSAIVEGTADGIIRVDADLRIQSWTRGAERILGYSREEIVGKPVSLIVPKDLQFDVQETMREQMVGHLGVIHTETTRINKQGKKVHVQLTRIPLKDATGKTVVLMAIFKDISEQKKLQKEKIQLKSEQIQLQKKLETLERNTAMTRVAAKVAHEIRTPLGVLFLKSDLLLEKLNHAFDNWGNDEPDIYYKSLDKCLSDIQRQISRLEEIANNYLHLSKSRAMEREDVNVKQFMKELEAELKEQYGRDDLALQFSLDHDAGMAYFDPQQFQRVFANLVRNSREAIQNANISEGIIQIQANRQDENLIFRIIDNGPGMPDEIRETVFDPFTTTKSIGTGLGLYLTCEIVENHGGTITIDSEPGKGTAIQIIIPAEDQKES